MDTMTTPSGTQRLPRARVTVPLLGLVGAALLAGPVLKSQGEPNEAAILGMASARGMAPLVDVPSKGTEIFQWDAELKDIAPFFIGAVINPDYRTNGKHYVLVKRPHADGLYIAIKKGEMRYWIRKL